MTIILIIIAALIALFFIAAALAPKTYRVERSIEINRPVAEVFNYLKHLKNQDNYSKWVRTDSQMKKTFKGTDGTVGFVYSWDGNKQAGAGEQEIKLIQENERLEVEVRFIRPFTGVAGAPFTTRAVSTAQTEVTWGLHSNMKYPLNIMLLFMNMDKFLGKDIEASLQLLKQVLEERPVS